MTERIPQPAYEKHEETYLLQRNDMKLNTLMTELASLAPPQHVHMESRADVQPPEADPVALQLELYNDGVYASIARPHQKEAAYLSLNDTTATIMMDIDEGTSLYQSLQTYVADKSLPLEARRFARYLQSQLPNEKHQGKTYQTTRLVDAYEAVHAVGQTISRHNPTYAYKLAYHFIPIGEHGEGASIGGYGPLATEPEALHESAFMLQVNSLPRTNENIFYSVTHTPGEGTVRTTKKPGGLPQSATLEDTHKAVQLAEALLDTALTRLSSGSDS